MKRKLLITVLFALLIPAASWGQSLDGLFGIKIGSDYEIIHNSLLSKDFTRDYILDDQDRDYFIASYIGNFDLYGYILDSVFIAFRDEEFLSYQIRLRNFPDIDTVNNFIISTMYVFNLIPATDSYLRYYTDWNFFKASKIDFYIEETPSGEHILSIVATGPKL